MNRKKVLFIVPGLPHYRIAFHRLVRQLLESLGIEYLVAVSSPSRADSERSPTWFDSGAFGSLSFAAKLSDVRFCVFGHELIYQRGFLLSQKFDLVILVQEGKYLLNYLLIATRGIIHPRLALFGHGRNFQSSRKHQLSESLKRIWSRRVYWWFVYNELSRNVVESIGFPRSNITVFNNSIDVNAISEQIKSITPEMIAMRRRKLGIVGTCVGLFIGGMYSHKRLSFLIEAARLIRDEIPDFELILVGDGPDSHLAKAAAMNNPFIHYAGRAFGQEKSEIALCSSIFLMPGLVGLAVLDSFAYGLPLVTTAVTFHSPEIAYLRDGENGVIVQEWSDPRAYAKAVVRIFRNDELRDRLTRGARADANRYSIENMAALFVDGVEGALRGRSTD
jgi:glycosyltransferase involved in cell wall biosynthesis